MNRVKLITLAALSLLDLAAAGFAWQGLAGADASADPPARSSAGVVPASPPEPPIFALGDDSEILARPLFAKSRRPWSGTNDAGGAMNGTSSPAGLKLHAIIEFDRSARAFVTSDSVKAGRWLSVGENFENWTVAAISAQEIALSHNANHIEIGLDYAEDPGRAKVPPPPSAAKNDAPPPPPAPSKIVTPNAFAGSRGAKRGEH